MQVDLSGCGTGVCHSDVIACFKLDWRFSRSNVRFMQVDFSGRGWELITVICLPVQDRLEVFKLEYKSHADEFRRILPVQARLEVFKIKCKSLAGGFLRSGDVAVL